MGIAEAVVGAVRAEAARHPGARVAKVGMRIGELAGVNRDSLEFCYELLVEGTELERAALAIETTPRDELEVRWLELEEPDGTRPAGAQGTQ